MAATRKVIPEITKPYRVPLVIDNKPLVDLPRLCWTVKTADASKSFNFSTGTEMQAMHIWRTQCGGSEIVMMYSYEPDRI